MEIQKRLSVLACRWSRSPHNSICKWGLQSRPVFHPWRKWCQTITSQDYKWGCKSCMNVSLEHEAGVCVCVCVYACVLSHVLLFVTTMDCSLPGSWVHEISQARILKWIAISFSYMYLCACIHTHTHAYTNGSNYLVKHFPNCHKNECYLLELCQSFKIV